MEPVGAEPELADECHDSTCIHCGLDFDFELPESIVAAAHRNELVIFAGAGISTEVPTVFPRTVLEIAADRIKVKLGGTESFPEVLGEFQNRFGRTDLVRMIKRKFDFINSFRSPKLHATRFHRELATMPYLRDVVTTNWDTYFEELCGATPFVSGEDIALWEMPGRRVLKIHGSISNLASLVVTETDYAKRLERLGSDVMGGLLRQLLATRTVVFIGYSLSDWNFRRLYEALLADMNEFAPAAYVVSPHSSETENDLGMQVLRTSGVHFLSTLKDELVGHCFIGDETYDQAAEMFDLAVECDPRLQDDVISHIEYPAVVYSWFYNDGLKDICDRIVRLRKTGEYSNRHHVVAMARFYDGAYDRAIEAERYGDAAYIDGYLNGLFVLLDDDWQRAEGEEDDPALIDVMPLYFVFGSESPMRTEEDFLEALEQSRRRSPKTRAVARKILEDVPEGMILTHAPFLNDSELADE